MNMTAHQRISELHPIVRFMKQVEIAFVRGAIQRRSEPVLSVDKSGNDVLNRGGRAISPMSRHALVVGTTLSEVARSDAGHQQLRLLRKRPLVLVPRASECALTPACEFGE